MTEETGSAWRKSSYSNENGGSCVEVADLPDGGVLIRDTKDRTRPAVRCAPSAWNAFIQCVKAGGFR